MPLTLSLLFAAALMASLLVRFWLATRQIRHVARHRATVPPLFVDQVSLAEHQKAADYTAAQMRFGLIELAWSSALLVGWTLLGGLDALNGAVIGLGWVGLWQQLALLAAFTIVSSVLDMPFTLYQTFVLEARFGFNKTTWALWCMDLVKSTLLGAALGLPLAAVILWLMGSAGTWWWLWAWGVWSGFSLLLMWIYPSFIAPFFNKFKPLEDEGLKSRVTALMERCGFQAKGLFVMDGSRRSAHSNAYFTGFGRSKRVVFYDTLIERLQPGEVDAVLAHELGHFHHRHITRRMVMMFAMSLGGFALLGWLSGQVWFYLGLGVVPNLPALAGGTTPNDALALLLFMLAVPVFMFFVSPLMAQMSRRDEFQADAFAVAKTNGADLASALLRLYQNNASTLTPDPLYARFYFSHPPASERLPRLVGTPTPKATA